MIKWLHKLKVTPKSCEHLESQLIQAKKIQAKQVDATANSQRLSNPL